MSSQTLPPPQGPEYARCGTCGHIEPEHRPDAGPCLVCDDCAAYAPAAVLPPTDRAVLDRVHGIARRLAAHAVGFQDVLDDSDRGPWARTVGADIAELVEALDSPAAAVLPTPADPTAEEHRLALSEALDLGTGAPWDAIRERVAELRRMAAEAQQPARCPHGCDTSRCPCLACDAEHDAEARGNDGQGDDDPTESVIYEVVGDWGVDSADSVAGARAAVAKWLRAYPKCGAYAQQRIYREWSDGSEFYGPWTDLPAPAAAAQDGVQSRG